MSALASIPRPLGARRLIGPIPPRGKDGKLRLKAKDAAGKEIEYDALDRLTFGAGSQPDEEAVKGLRLWQIDLSPEPLVQVYARNEHEALNLWKKEMGIIRLQTETDPIVTEVV